MAHTEDVDEWGLTGTLSWKPRADGRGLPVLDGSETLDLYARGDFGESRALGFGADLDLQGGLHLGYEAQLNRSGAESDADHRIRLRFQSRF